MTHHNALDADFYLRIAPELFLKRCIVGGMNVSMKWRVVLEMKGSITRIIQSLHK